MKTFGREFLFLWLLLWSEVECYERHMCAKMLSISCGVKVIAIKNASRNILSDLLEQCNARHECNVPVVSDECVHVDYQCKLDTPTLETKISSRYIMHMKPNQSAIGLMSENYDKGIYQSVENTDCNITFADHADTNEQKMINVLLFDFSASTTEYCLSVKDSTIPPFCSDLHKHYEVYGPLNMTNKRKFSFTLTSSATKIAEASEVRFWFHIYVSEGLYFYQVECHSKPPEYTTLSSILPTNLSTNLPTTQPTNLPTTRPTNLPLSANDIDEMKLSASMGGTSIAIISTFGILLGLVGLAIISLIIYFKYWRNAQSTDRPEFDDQVYYEISGATLGETPILRLAPVITMERQHIEGIENPVYTDVEISDDMGIMDNPCYDSGIVFNIHDSEVQNDDEKVTDEPHLAEVYEKVTGEMHLVEDDEKVTDELHLADDYEKVADEMNLVKHMKVTEVTDDPDFVTDDEKVTDEMHLADDYDKVTGDPDLVKDDEKVTEMDLVKDEKVTDEMHG